MCIFFDFVTIILQLDVTNIQCYKGVLMNELWVALIAGFFGLVGAVVPSALTITVLIRKWPTERSNLNMQTDNINVETAEKVLGMTQSLLDTFNLQYDKQQKMIDSLNDDIGMMKSIIWLLELQIEALGGVPLISSDGLFDLPAKQLDLLVDKMKRTYRRINKDAELVVAQFSKDVEDLLLGNGENYETIS